jgi:hypothetical protein
MNSSPDSYRSRKPCVFHWKVKKGWQIIKNTAMKKYPTFNLRENREAVQQKLDELLLFQELLRNHDALNAEFCGKAEEIAAGIQAWIDALKCRLEP